MMRRRGLGLASALLFPALLAAQGTTRVLIVTGLSAEPHFAREFATAAALIDDAARTSWHVRDSDLVYLSEDPAADTKRMTGKSTRENVAAAFASLAARVRPGDLILIYLIGHGSGELQSSAVNLPGPDPTAMDYAAWLAPLRAASVVFVNAATGSGDFAPLLAAPGRVVITATKTGMERNESIFAHVFALALTGPEADANKDGRVTITEAFAFAKTQVAKTYESSSHLLTEHALIADTNHLGDRLVFGGAQVSDDPRVAALIGERRVLEARVDSLRGVKATMDSVAYQDQLEKLLLDIAARTQAIKALQPSGRP